MISYLGAWCISSSIHLRIVLPVSCYALVAIFFLPRAKEKPVMLAQVKHNDLPNSYRIIPRHNTKKYF